jgi:predicted enzyme related to lactoylglutathione lyase
MKQIVLILTALVSFSVGYAFRTQHINQNQESMKRVTSIGGIFFKCKDPKSMRAWYAKHLGLQTDSYGTNFEWRHDDDGAKRGFTQWSPFSETSTHFKNQWMINYRVENLEWLVTQLAKEGVTIVDKIETFDYGKFVHVLDLEGNKIELWEPNDEEYAKICEGITK